MLHRGDKHLENKIIALVTAVHRDRYQIITTEYGEIYGKLKAANYYHGLQDERFPTVGDRVEIEYNNLGDSLILETLPRKSKFLRLNPTPGMGEQLVAANFDYVFITMSMNYDFNIKRLERYLSIAWKSGGTPVVVLTKADLTTNATEYVVKTMMVAPGVTVVPVSAITGEGMDQIFYYLQKNVIIVLLGSSGVGKSTFINALLKDQVMKTSEIREDDSKGHHTTTHRQLLFLKNGAMLIDTPGMRTMGMTEDTQGISRLFEDVEELIKKCRFADCTHHNEPGCAVLKALEEGNIPMERWINYQKLMKEARFLSEKNSKKQKSTIFRKPCRTMKYKEDYDD